jgi:hypothetical protein
LPRAASGFSACCEEAPSPGRRRAPSSGLMARDQTACVTQASTKLRKAQHDEQDLGIRRPKSSATFRQPEAQSAAVRPVSSRPWIPRQDRLGTRSRPRALGNPPLPQGTRARSPTLRLPQHDPDLRLKSVAQWRAPNPLALALPDSS